MLRLPANRDMELIEEIIDGPSSVIIEKAATWLHSLKGCWH